MIRAETDMFMFEAIFRTCLTHQLIIVSIIKSGISEIHELEFLFLTGALLSFIPLYEILNRFGDFDRKDRMTGRLVLFRPIV